ncbi:MAG: hypothetical protein A2669_01570 [Candidatus Yanofskybacteria bacterium RIFCSPHIGHO2_01_FULL_48_25b]|uniref:Translation initiation factor beta propellor-like domain-containing protein n=1 Tax=Candidatus Yanofskybacteria bacterium RIFCSPHIGHO2_01_FULL_48_25b TaxID=1802672 RepID=A0A1F8EZZ4_9BACT|nr:MAG: hypothetical protein A2669_01570 [Candidatus Yanofskybacteria bacterium RIFCSPHIGHO2_01_FULL_48_25b]
MNQKLLILLIVVTAFASFLAGYLLTSKDAGRSALEEQRGLLIDRFDGIAGGATPTPLPAGLLKAADESALGLTSALGENAVLFYHADSGYVSKLDLETRAGTLISKTSLPGLTDILWSPDKNRVITVTQKRTGPAYTFFDYHTREFGDLGRNIGSAVFSPDSRRIALFRTKDSGSEIQISDFNGRNSRTLLKTRLENVRLFWPRENMLAFTASDYDQTSQSFYALSPEGELMELASGAENLSAQWSHDGSRVIFSQREGDRYVLGLYDTAAKKTLVLPLGARASDCAWSLDGTKIYCSIQTSGETSIVLISLLDNQTTVLFSGLAIVPEDIFLSHLENFLVMTNFADKSIWAVKLAP